MPIASSAQRRFAAAIAAVLLLAACGAPAAEPAVPEAAEVVAEGPGGEERSAGSGRAAAADDDATEAAAEASQAPDPEPEGPPVTLAFGGDVMFEGMLRPQLAADPAGLLAPIAPVVEDADLTVVNLETAITEAGDPAPKQYVFRAPPTGLQALHAAGVDVVSLANNHGMDFGVSGLEDTLDAAAEVGVPVIGAGRDVEEAYAPVVVDVRGRVIAVIGATQVLDSAFLTSWVASADRPGLASAKGEHEDRLVQAVASARADADTVVVYLHWGVEKERCPSASQQDLARRLVDAGADIIVGGHAHRLQGAGMLEGSLVAYGLGNFVFYASEGPGAETGVLRVVVEGRDILEHRWTPARLRGGIPHPLEGEAAATALRDWEALRACAGLTD